MASTPSTTSITVHTTNDAGTATKHEDAEAILIASKGPQYLTGIRLALLVASLTLVTFLILLDMSILSTAIPQITTQFHSLPDVGWYSGAYQLTNAALQPLTGKLYTHLRKKDVFLAHLFLFELGSLVCGLAGSSSMLIAGRAVAGLGSAGLMNGSLTILADGAPMEKRPLYMGILLGFAQAGLVSGPLIGGALTQHVSWRWCFYLNLPIGGIAAVVIFFVRISDSNANIAYSKALFRKVVPLLDLPGFVLFAPACVMFLLALQFGGVVHPWGSGTVVGLFVGAGVLAVGFGIWEARVGESAMIPGVLLKNRILLASLGQSFALGAALIVPSLWLPMYFQAVRGASPTQSGVDTLPMILSQCLFIVISGGAISKLGYYIPWSFLCGTLIAIGGGLLSTLTPTTPAATWIGYLILIGAGRGSGMQISLVAAQASSLPPSLIPVSLALLIFVQNLSGAIFNIVANTIFNQTLIRKIAEYAPGVEVQAALDAGASAASVRKLVGGDEVLLSGVLRAYGEGLRGLWLMCVGFGVVLFLVSFGVGWRDVRKKDGEVGEKEKVEVCE